MTVGEKEEQVLTFQDLLRNYLQLAKRGIRYWKRGVALFTVVMVAGMAWVVTKPRVYRSEAKFQVQEPDTPGAAERGQEETQRSIEGRLNQVFNSRSNLIALINRLHLYDHLNGHTSETKIVDLFLGALERKVETDVVQLAFVYKEPERAQRTVRELIQLFVDARRVVAENRAREGLQTAEAQLRQMESQLAERQETFDQFYLANQAMVEEIRRRRGGPSTIQVGNNGAPTTQPEFDRTMSRRSRTLQARVNQLQQSLESLQNPGSSSSSGGDEPSDIQAMRERVRTKQAEVQGLVSRNLTPDHPTRAAAERELATLQAQLNLLVARFRGAQQNAQDLSSAERHSRIDQVSHDLEEARTELANSQRQDRADATGIPQPAPTVAVRNPLTLGNIVEVEARYDQLTTDMTTTRTSYQDLLRRKFERQSDLRRAQLTGGEQIRIIDQASLPVEPEPPSRSKLSMVVGLVAILLGLGTALVSGFIDTRIYDLGDLQRWGEVAELPFIPDLYIDLTQGSMGRPPAASPNVAPSPPPSG